MDTKSPNLVEQTNRYYQDSIFTKNSYISLFIIIPHPKIYTSIKISTSIHKQKPHNTGTFRGAPAVLKNNRLTYYKHDFHLIPKNIFCFFILTKLTNAKHNLERRTKLNAIHTTCLAFTKLDRLTLIILLYFKSCKSLK